MPSTTESVFSPENADRVHAAIAKAVNAAFPDKSAPPHSIDVLAGLALAAAEIMAGHEKPEVRAALVQHFRRVDRHPPRARRRDAWAEDVELLDVERLRAKADITPPTIPAGTVENDPFRTFTQWCTFGVCCPHQM